MRNYCFLFTKKKSKGINSLGFFFGKIFSLAVAALLFLGQLKQTTTCFKITAK